MDVAVVVVISVCLVILFLVACTVSVRSTFGRVQPRLVGNPPLVASDTDLCLPEAYHGLKILSNQTKILLRAELAKLAFFQLILLDIKICFK